jgi:hypothetical protein
MMNSKNTCLWFVLAAMLFATIFFLDRCFRAPVSTVTEGWPDFQTAQATSLQVIPSGVLEIRADHTNDNWFLTKPLAYPAQSAAIQALLGALARLTPVARLTAAELRQQPTAEQDYGFDNPAFSLVLEASHQKWQIKIGRRTPPGNQVYLRIVGVDGAFVTDADWLKLLPRQPNDWRDTSLVSYEGIYNWIVLTNGAKVIELRLDPTNHLWRMTRPLQARADSDRINLALQQLRAGRVDSFVTDDPKADLTAYGLEPAGLDLWLGHAGGLAEGLHLGKTLTNNPALAYAKREGWNGVITTLKAPLAPWRGTVNDFRNPHLIELTSPVNELEVSVAQSSSQFILQRQASNVWQVAGQSFPVDSGSVQNFIQLLAGLKATDYSQDAVTPSDLLNYGLTKPALQITLRPAVGDTNQTLAQLSISAPQTNGVFVRRADEEFIYRIDPADLTRIPEAGWEFRERHIWNFSEQDITQITLRQSGKTKQILHTARNVWTLAPGSTGQVYGPSLEEAAHELSQLTVVGWVGYPVLKPEIFGLNTNNLQLELDLKNGRKFSVDFGTPIGDQSALASVMLDGERWAFVFPAAAYQYVVSFLTIPSNAP